jgi:hypothetical protein
LKMIYKFEEQDRDFTVPYLSRLINPCRLRSFAFTN